MSTPKTSILLPLSTLLRESPCRPDERIADFTARHGRPPDETSTLMEWAEATESRSDLLWGLRFVPAEKAKQIHVYVATRVARRVLHIFEAEYPDDARPRHAIEVAEKWLESPESVISKEELRCAANAADDAAANATSPHATTITEAAAFAAYAAASTADATYADADLVARYAYSTSTRASYVIKYAYACDVEVATHAVHADQRQDFLDALERYL